MRWIKIGLFIIVLLLALVGTSVYWRNDIALRVGNHYLNGFIGGDVDGDADNVSGISRLVGLSLDCLDFSFTPDWDITIAQLCLSHPLASAKIQNLTLQWSTKPQITITAITLNDLTVSGSASVDPYLISKPDSNPADTPLPTTAFHQLMAKIAHFTLPASIEVNRFSYQPYNRPQNQAQNQAHSDNQQKTHYKGHISAVDGLIKVSLRDPQAQGQGQGFFDAQLSTQPAAKAGAALKGQIMADLIPMRRFLALHGIYPPIGDAISRASLKGQLNSHFEWQNQQFKTTSRFEGIELSSEGIDISDFNTGPLSMNSTIDLQASLNLHQLQLSFGANDHFTVQYNEQAILDAVAASLTANGEEDPPLLSLLKDNPGNGFNLQPQGQWLFDFAQQRLTLPGLNFARNGQWPLRLQLNNVSATLTDKLTANAEFALGAKAKLSTLQYKTDKPAAIAMTGSITDATFSEGEFTGKAAFEAHIKTTVAAIQNPSAQAADIKINSTLDQLAFGKMGLTAKGQFDGKIKTTLAAVQDVTTDPVDIIAVGTVDKTADLLQLNFKPSSQMSLGKLKIGGETEEATEITLSAAQVGWQGLMAINDDNSNGNKPTFDLTVAATLPQLFAKSKVKALAKIALTQVNATVQGSLNKIQINGDMQVDNLPLAHFKVTGNTTRPTIAVTAKALSLVDLLASGLAVSIHHQATIELIDGAVDYHLSGRITDFDQLNQNDLTLSLSLRDVTGKVNEFWLQELNWQQQLRFSEGDMTTNAQQNNFSMALIEAGTEISDLSARTNIDLIQQTFRVTLDNVSGKAFGGSFAIPTAQWPFDQPPQTAKPLILTVDGIDLAKVVALEQQQGIHVTGRISGQLPVSIYQSTVTINDGELHNITDGVIQIKDNPAVAQLKQSRTELKLAFDALQNLHYHQLTSLVTMTEEGQMLLETAIKGINPDLDNEVNFNLDLDYDLLGLIESLTITDNFENKIIERTKPNDQ